MPVPSAFLGGKEKGREEREKEMEDTGDDSVDPVTFFTLGSRLFYSSVIKSPLLETPLRTSRSQ